MSARNISAEQFRELVSGEGPVLVDFWAPWCTYCRKISAAYDQVAREQGEAVAVVKVNIDEQPRIAAQEKIEVIPTLVLYRGGKALGSMAAPDSKAAIDEFIRKTLSAH